jgi:hypothetical protein
MSSLGRNPVPAITKNPIPTPGGKSLSVTRALNRALESGQLFMTHRVHIGLSRAAGCAGLAEPTERRVHCNDFFFDGLRKNGREGRFDEPDAIFPESLALLCEEPFHIAPAELPHLHTSKHRDDMQLEQLGVAADGALRKLILHRGQPPVSVFLQRNVPIRDVAGKLARFLDLLCELILSLCPSATADLPDPLTGRVPKIDDPHITVFSLPDFRH